MSSPRLVIAILILSYFFAGHALKIATDAGFLKETGGGKPEIQIRVMPQLTF